MLKRCLLHDGKMVVKYKTLMFSILHKPLISLEFASEVKSARKYALDFWGRTENSDEKTAGYLKSESALVALPPEEDGSADMGLKSDSFCRNQFPLSFADSFLHVGVRIVVS